MGDCPCGYWQRADTDFVILSATGLSMQVNLSGEDNWKVGNMIKLYLFYATSLSIPTIAGSTTYLISDESSTHVLALRHVWCYDVASLPYQILLRSSIIQFLWFSFVLTCWCRPVCIMAMASPCSRSSEVFCIPTC
jgi:hypothetical protein